MFSNFLKSRLEQSKSQLSIIPPGKSPSENEFERLLFQDNNILHREIIRAYSNYMISYTPRAFKSNTYDKLKSNPEYYKDFDANLTNPYSFEQFAYKFHFKELFNNTSSDFKSKFCSKGLKESLKSIENTTVLTDESQASKANAVNKIDYIKYKRLLIESKRCHFFNCLSQFFTLNNFPVFVSK